MTCGYADGPSRTEQAGVLQGYSVSYVAHRALRVMS